MKNCLFVLFLSLFLGQNSWAQLPPTDEYPLTIEGNLEDRIEMCVDPSSNSTFYFAPFRNKRLYNLNDASGLTSYAGSSAPFNGFVERREPDGTIVWSKELFRFGGDVSYRLLDPNSSFWVVTDKAFDIAYDPIHELVVVAVQITNVNAPAPFGIHGTAVTQPGVHFFFFEANTGQELSVYRTPNIANTAFPKDMKISNNTLVGNNKLYLANQDHGACSGLLIYDLAPVASTGVPFFEDNVCLNPSLPAGEVGITEISLDPYNQFTGQVFVGGTFSNGNSLLHSGGSITAAANPTSFIMALGNNAPPTWIWGYTVNTNGNSAKTVGVTPHADVHAGQQGMPILVGYTESQIITFASGFGFSPVPAQSFMIAYDKAGSGELWGEEIAAYEAVSADANDYTATVDKDLLAIAGIPREDALTAPLYATPAIDTDLRHILCYRTQPTAGVVPTLQWESFDFYGPSIFFQNTDLELTGEYCFEYGSFAYGSYTLDNGDDLKQIGYAPLDAYILRLDPVALPGSPPIAINTRLANPNAPTAANGNGGYEQTGNGLPGLGESAQELLLFPNPVTRNTLYLQAQATGATQLRISNMAGQVIWERALLPAQNDLPVSTADWPSGIYVLSYLDALGEMRNVKIQVAR